MKTALNWFRFQNKADDSTVVDIYIVDIIGDWIDELINEYYGMKATITAKAFIDQLSTLDAGVKSIRLHINSPGGDVFAAVTIANALRDQQLTKGRAVDTFIDGIAASAASIIAMAGKTVTMADNAILMIHKPLTGLWGNATALRAAAAELDTIEQNAIVQTYKWHSKLDDAAILALLTGENGVDGTWMGADEAIANGFATAKTEGLAVAASINPKAIVALKVPDAFKARVEALIKKPAEAPKAETPVNVIRACTEAGCPELAADLVEANATPEQVTAKVAAAKSAKDTAHARATTIRLLCTESKATALADSLIESALSIEKVKAHLVTVAAIATDVPIDTSHHPDNTGGGKVPAIDTVAVYAAENAPFNKRG